MNDEQRVDFLQKENYRLIDMHREDMRYMQIALNLTGKPKHYLNKAKKMIERNGIIKSLKKSIQR